MNFQVMKKPAAALLLIAVGLWAVQAGRAQDSVGERREWESGKRGAEQQDRIKMKQKAVGAMHKVIAKMHEPHLIREAAAALAEAEGADEKEEAEEKLTQLLNEYFDDDMKRREDELAAVEERVKKLHSLLERRREKKQDIINLQVEVLLNEADGLGFFDDEGLGGPMHAGSFRFEAHPPEVMPLLAPRAGYSSIAAPGSPFIAPAPARAPAPPKPK